jgi:hypothetical protein
MRALALVALVASCAMPTGGALRDFTFENGAPRPTPTLGLAAIVGTGLAVAVDECFGRSLSTGDSCKVTLRCARDAEGTLRVGDWVAAVSTSR